MKNENTGKAKNELRVELKYCEGCGGLGVRECGGGQVYCDSCTRKMEELAVGRGALGRTPRGESLSRQTLSRGTLSRGPILPVGKRSRLDDTAADNGRDLNEPESDKVDFDESDLDDFDSDEFDSDDFDANDLDAMTRIAAGGAA